MTRLMKISEIWKGLLYGHGFDFSVDYDSIGVVDTHK